MDREREWQLTQSYFSIKKFPGWLGQLIRSMRLNPDEIRFLEELDDAFIANDIEIQKFENATEMERFFGIHGMEPDEAMPILSRLIAEAYSDYDEMAAADVPYIDRHLMLVIRRVTRAEHLRRKIRAAVLHKKLADQAASGTDEDFDPDSPIHRPDRITNHDIAKAREYPLERLIGDVEIGPRGYILCRWHTDNRPSMLVKNGFGFCFSCNVTVDAIRWLMEVDGHSFVEAVKRLSGRIA